MSFPESESGKGVCLDASDHLGCMHGLRRLSQWLPRLRGIMQQQFARAGNVACLMQLLAWPSLVFVAVSWCSHESESQVDVVPDWIFLRNGAVTLSCCRGASETARPVTRGDHPSDRCCEVQAGWERMKGFSAKWVFFLLKTKSFVFQSGLALNSYWSSCLYVWVLGL